MKDNFVFGAAFAALLVSFSAHFPSKEEESVPASNPELVALVEKVEELRLQNQAISKWLADLEKSLESSVVESLPPGVVDVDELLVDRVLYLEESIEKLVSSGLLNENPIRSTQLRVGALREEKQGGNQEQLGSATGEAAFNSDSGRSISPYVDSIEASLSASNANIDLHGLECLESVCKVTYQSKLSHDDISGGGVEVADLLTDYIEDEEIEVHYGRDEFGNDVAYIQIHD